MYHPLRRPRRGFTLNLTPSQILVLGFAVLIAIGSFLLWLPMSNRPGVSTPYLDALFTATSAVAVTGLVVVDTGTHWSMTGQLIILFLFQAGGLGIMTVSALAFLALGRKIGLKDRLVMQQALSVDTTAGVVRLTRKIILVTLLFEAVGATVLGAFFYLWKGISLKQSIYWGIFHAVSAFNNAGFDVTSESLTPFSLDPFVLAVVIVLIISGGIGYLVMDDVWQHRRWARLSLHSRLVITVTAALILVPMLVYLLLEHANPNTLGQMDWFHKVTNAFFGVITARTAGFNSVDTGALRDATLLLTMVLMFIGGSPGGTAGGIRTTTFAVIALTIRATARGKEEIELMERRLPKHLVDRAVTMAAIFMAFVILVTGIYLVTEEAILYPAGPFSFVNVMFDAVSAMGTVGLSTGLTPELSQMGRIVTIVAMFVGRVGPLTIAVALAQRKSQRLPIHYPEDRVIIG